MNEATARMLRLARRDLRAVQGMLDNREMFPDEIFGFHAQQAVEKAAKAWLDGRGVEYPKRTTSTCSLSCSPRAGGRFQRHATICAIWSTSRFSIGTRPLRSCRSIAKKRFAS
jgi:hypothetical protein